MLCEFQSERNHWNICPQSEVALKHSGQEKLSETQNFECYILFSTSSGRKIRWMSCTNLKAVPEHLAMLLNQTFSSKHLALEQESSRGTFIEKRVQGKMILGSCVTPGSSIQKPCLSFMAVAMIKYTDKSNFMEKEFRLA